jgi:hypothetical protein
MFVGNRVRDVVRMFDVVHSVSKLVLSAKFECGKDRRDVTLLLRNSGLIY